LALCYLLGFFGDTQLNAMNHQSEKTTSTIVSLDPKVIKVFLNPIIDELQQQKGLIVLDVKLHDGTKVMIKL
jgi:hypothetical protein